MINNEKELLNRKYEGYCKLENIFYKIYSNLNYDNKKIKILNNRINFKDDSIYQIFKINNYVITISFLKENSEIVEDYSFYNEVSLEILNDKGFYINNIMKFDDIIDDFAAFFKIDNSVFDNVKKSDINIEWSNFAVEDYENLNRREEIVINRVDKITKFIADSILFFIE